MEGLSPPYDSRVSANLIGGRSADKHYYIYLYYIINTFYKINLNYFK